MSSQKSDCSVLSEVEAAKRSELMRHKPYVAKKLAHISEMEARGEVSPIIRLEKSYLCNFHCTHCCAEHYMDRHLNVLGIEDERHQMDLDDVRHLSQEADSLGLGRFVITGGEPLVMKDFDEVVAALDPERHYIVSDTNGWFLDGEKAKHLREIGVDKIQLSLDSSIEAEHDAFRNKPGSFKRVMRAIDACLDAGLNLILSTVLVKGRVYTDEFRVLCDLCKKRGIGLYVTYAKPTGACTEHQEFVVNKHDADKLREYEKEYNVFTHMTPSYGSYKGCIAVKGIVTVTSTMEVTPCPHIDFSLGNLRQTPLKEILARGMNDPWLGEYRPDCLIGENPFFIARHMEIEQKCKLLPVPWGDGFLKQDTDVSRPPMAQRLAKADASATLFDDHGRFAPSECPEAVPISRRYYRFASQSPDMEMVHARFTKQFPGPGLPSSCEFAERIQRLRDRLAAVPCLRNILRGVYAPFILARQQYADLGESLEKVFLPAVASSFVEARPDLRFVKHFRGTLTGRLSTAPGSRQEKLREVNAMGAVVGCYFPCLTEISVPEAQACLECLPDDFILSGAEDISAALVGTPELLINTERYAPLLWLAGSVEENRDAGFHFEAYGANLTFNRRLHFGKRAEYWACGITILD